MQPPNEARGFIHKSRFTRGVIGGVRGLITGGPTAALTGFAQGLVSQTEGSRTRTGGQPQATRSLPMARKRRFKDPNIFDEFGNRRTRALNAPARSLVAGRGPCAPGQIRIGKSCVNPPGPRGGTGAFLQEARFETGPRFGGQLGGYQPMVDMREVRVCMPGDVLGRDGFCYSKGDISNKNREWPRGRRPLGTPGEMAALAKAAAFGRRMETTVKRMQRIGVLKKPRRGAPRARAQKLLTPGVVQIQQE